LSKYWPFFWSSDIYSPYENWAIQGPTKAIALKTQLRAKQEQVQLGKSLVQQRREEVQQKIIMVMPFSTLIPTTKKVLIFHQKRKKSGQMGQD
jgi:hypothetical protein